MPSREVIPPYHPLHEDRSAKVIYLTGRSKSNDPWFEHANQIIGEKLMYRRQLLYVASPFSVAPDIREAQEHHDWKKEYRERAIENGAILLWFSSDKVGKYKGQEIQDILDYKASNPDLAIACGAGMRCNTFALGGLRAELAELSIEIQPSLKATCEESVRLCEMSGQTV